MPEPTVTFRISIDPELVPDADVMRILEALEDFAPLLEELGDIMSEAQKENFASQGESFGQPWASLSASTLREKERLGFSPDILVRTGKLENAAGGSVVTNGSEVTSGFDIESVPYAAYHQPDSMGGSNAGGRLPTRLLVSFSPGEQEQMLQAVQDYFDEMSGGLSGVSITMEEV